MKIFQLPTGRKVWHFFGKLPDHPFYEDRMVPSLCGSGCFHYKANGKKREDLLEAEYDGSQQLCPACVQRAYKEGLIEIFTKDQADHYRKLLMV